MFQPLAQSSCILLMTLRLFFTNGGELFLPAFEPGAPVHTYTGYTLRYNERNEQPDWVAYELTAQEVYSKEAERSNRFLPDPEIPTGSASDADYRRSGYDRGHLAPAADMRFSSSAMKECFYYSNISPQDPSFNRGIWSSLEEQTRDWAMEAGSVCITTGPLFYGEYSPVIGPDRVAVPDFFFKAILDYRSATPKAIAFIIPNRKADSPLPKFACSVDEAERLSGLDFFPALPDCIETTVEATENISLWFPEDH